VTVLNISNYKLNNSLNKKLDKTTTDTTIYTYAENVQKDGLHDMIEALIRLLKVRIINFVSYLIYFNLPNIINYNERLNQQFKGSLNLNIFKLIN
jgi:hypothetical protein